MSAFILEQRRLPSALPLVKQWSECAGSKSDTHDGADAHRQWWETYDAQYGLTGWDYRVREVRK